MITLLNSTTYLIKFANKKTTTQPQLSNTLYIREGDEGGGVKNILLKGNLM